MATSAVAICNLALSFLGDSATVASIDPPEQSTQARMCAIYYPIAKQAMLELFDWSFATEKKSLAKLSEDALPEWQGVYAMPAGCLRIIRIRPSSEHVMFPNWRYPIFEIEPPDADYELIGRRIYTNAENPVATYITSEVTEGSFSPTFVTAFAYYLAMEIAGARVKGKEGYQYAQNLQKQFQIALSAAKTRDASNQKKRVTFTPIWIQRR